MALARRNEALEEYAALVAHELKSPLLAALAADDPSTCVRQALGLVDALLEAASQGGEPGTASPSACLDGALRDIGARRIAATADLPERLPLPSTVLRLILRNLLRNAVAAGASSVHVSARQCSGTWLLEVADNGAGLNARSRYRSGSGLGLRLCRRIAGRHGGFLELVSRPAGGTLARLELRGAA
jgi:signal transduction histidine kinase